MRFVEHWWREQKVNVSYPMKVNVKVASGYITLMETKQITSCLISFSSAIGIIAPFTQRHYNVFGLGAIEHIK